MHKISKLIQFMLLITATCSLTGCLARKPNIDIPTTPPPPRKIDHPDVALVLGGGGARGFAHVGVIKELEKNHIPINLIVGTSAGSLVGALYADDPHANHLIKKLSKANKRDLFDISLAHPFLGFITGNDLERFYLEHLQAHNFNQLKIPFIAMATDFTTGQPIQLRSGPIAPAINASAAIPLAFRPVHMYGRTLVDGGVTDNVAADIARRYHPKLIIAVDINKNLDDKLPANAFSILSRTYNITAQRLSDKITQQADIVLYPDVRQIGTFDDSDRNFLIKAGEKVAIKAMPLIKAEMKKDGIPFTQGTTIHEQKTPTQRITTGTHHS